MSFLLVATGGFFGSMMRFYISFLMNKHVIGTWIANFFGSVLLGFIFKFHLAGSISEWLWLLLGVGFCGAFTTFSTFSNETLMLLNDKRYGFAISYILATLILSLVTVSLILNLT